MVPYQYQYLLLRLQKAICERFIQGWRSPSASVSAKEWNVIATLPALGSCCYCWCTGLLKRFVCGWFRVPVIRWGVEFYTDAIETTNLFFSRLSGNSYTNYMGVRKKGNFWTGVTSRRGLSPRSQQRQQRPECRRNKDHARGAEDRNARTWTNTEGRCRRVARGKTRTRGPLCGGRHAPGATRIRTAAQAAHAGSIRGLANANRSLTMGIGCWSPLRTSSTTRKRYAGSARRRWML